MSGRSGGFYAHAAAERGGGQRSSATAAQGNPYFFFTQVIGLKLQEQMNGVASGNSAATLTSLLCVADSARLLLSLLAIFCLVQNRKLVAAESGISASVLGVSR